MMGGRWSAPDLGRLFIDHPASVGETYFGHLGFAARFGGSMVVGGLACMVHGLLPFCFVTSGSRRVRALHATLSGHPGRRADTARRSHELGDDAALNWSI